MIRHSSRGGKTGGPHFQGVEMMTTVDRFMSVRALRVLFVCAAAALLLCFAEAFLVGGGEDDPFAFLHLWFSVLALASAGWYLVRTRDEPHSSRLLAWVVLFGTSAWLVFVAFVAHVYPLLMKDFK